MTILNIINELSNTPLMNMKRCILNREKDNYLLKNIFFLTLSPDINFFIKKRPNYKKSLSEITLSLSEALSLMIDRVSTRDYTGNKSISFYQNLLESLSPDDAEILCRVVERNLKCGVSVALVNDNWPELIPTYTWMKAVTDPKDLVFPAIAQTKLDGMRVYVSFDENENVIVRSTGGNILDIWNVLDRDAKAFIWKDEKFDGELLCVNSNTNKPLSRQISNGFLTRAIRGTITREEANTIRFFVWDIVDNTQKIPYVERLTTIEQRFDNISRFEIEHKYQKFVLIDSCRVSNMNEVQELFEKKLEEGQEGIIVKNLNSIWEPKRSKYQVKLKSEKTADLLVVGIVPGNGKYEGMVGSLRCVSSDEKVVVDVAGLKDCNRSIKWGESQIGKIVEVKYNQKITKNGKGVDSLYLPRFSRERPDKIEANTSDEL